MTKKILLLCSFLNKRTKIKALIFALMALAAYFAIFVTRGPFGLLRYASQGQKFNAKYAEAINKAPMWPLDQALAFLFQELMIFFLESSESIFIFLLVRYSRQIS